MQRLDHYLVTTYPHVSRSRIRDRMKRGFVRVNGKVITKPGYAVSGTEVIEYIEDTYVSRGAYKLLGAFELFDWNVENRVCIDIGSSTGGFTQVLLEKGAKQVYAIDIGKDQLHVSLQKDERVFSYEQCGISDFSDYMNCTRIVCDASSVSFFDIFSDIDRLAGETAEAMILFKPQFETGARSLSVIQERVSVFIAPYHWSVLGACPAALRGKQGTREYMLYLKKH